VQLRSAYDIWPRYQTDRCDNQWFHGSTPVLALNSELDPQTPWQEASRIAAQFHGPAQHYLHVPDRAHGVLFDSFVREADAPTCGVQLAQSFLAHPNRHLDTRCIADLAPFDLSIAPDFTRSLFGVDDAYENPRPGN
jgi:hypothetical protein